MSPRYRGYVEPSETDARWLRATFELARKNRRAGEQPFAAILVGPDGEIVGEAVNANRVDRTRHAEITVVRETKLSREDLVRCTLYVNAEPCVMCAGAIGWSGIGTLVYGVSQREMGRQQVLLPGGLTPRFAGFADDLTVRSLLRLNPPITIRGPFLEAEAWDVVSDDEWRLP